jgi:hypothetical protein
LGIDDFVKSLPPGAAPLLVAVGGFGVEGEDRIGLLTFDGRVHADAYLPRGEIDGLISRIAAARKGGWNTMHATSWSLAWTDDDGPFVLIDQKGRLAWVERRKLHTRQRVFAAIATVEPYVSGDWTERGVRVRLADGSIHTIGSEHDAFPQIDPTYDGLNLMADTFWCHALARALSKGLGAPLVDCT